MKPTAILTSDWHIRETVPTCRTDDFEKSQWDKIRFISDLQQQYNCPVLHAGDLFHHWKPSPYLISKTIEYLPNQFYTVYGQHDLPQHNLDLKYKSGIYVLEKAGVLQVLPGTHWGQKLTVYQLEDWPIIVWHHMTWQGQPPYPGAPGSGNAYTILRKYHKKARLILTGDNHQSFMANFKECLLVNPGNITRQEAAQADYKPCVYLWDSSTNKTQPVYLPILDGVVSREHIEQKQARDARIAAFVERLDSEHMDSVNFEENLERYFQINENKIRGSVKSIVYNALED